MMQSHEYVVKFRTLFQIEVKLLNPEIFEGACEKCAEFGYPGMTFCSTDGNPVHYEPNETEYILDWLDDFKDGKTFPRFALEQRLNFSIKNVSRICLSQITRDRGFYCSESHGVRPVNQEVMIPTSLLKDESIMSKVEAAQYLLEEAYIECCEKNIPYPDSKYITMQGLTISFNASFSVGDFIRNCHSRTNNSFCDEANLVYRLMYREVDKQLNTLLGNNNVVDYRFWRHLINSKSCIDDSFYTRIDVFNGDFNVPACTEPNYHIKNSALCDFKKSAWFQDLQYLAAERPELFTENELDIIRSWKNWPDRIYSSYVGRVESPENAIKDTDYYKKHQEVDNGK